MTSDHETLRRLIVGTGEHRIDSFDAADRVLAAGWRPSAVPPATLARPEISDEMVERAARAVWDRDGEGGWDRAKIHFPGTIDFALGAARAALTAALTDGESNG